MPETPIKRPLNGERVRILYQLWGLQKKPREMVAVYVAFDLDRREHVLSGRPKFGTAVVHERNVIAMYHTERDIMQPEIYRGALPRP